MNILEEKLREIRQKIDETDLGLRVCNSHIQFMHEMKSSVDQENYPVSDYDKQMSKDEFRRMELQQKLKALMDECFEIQDRLFREED